jgi:lactoylglutathione lyase
MKTRRIATLVLSLSALSVASLHAQSNARKPIELDHTTVFVRDLPKSGEFYEKVLGLDPIRDPFSDGRHLWFRTGPHSQLHVVGGAAEITPTDIEVHMAFRVASVPDFTTHLDQLHEPYRNLKGDGKTSVRADGVHQIYFQDPDGYWIEVNDDRF